MSASEASVVLVDVADGSQLKVVETSSRKIDLENDESQEHVKAFRDTFQTFLRGNSVDVAVIRKRRSSGTHAASGISFKLEGLIQMNDVCEVQFIAPQTVSSVLKKHPIEIPAGLKKYQHDAFRTAAVFVVRNA